MIYSLALAPRGTRVPVSTIALARERSGRVHFVMVHKPDGVWLASEMQLVADMMDCGQLCVLHSPD